MRRTSIALLVLATGACGRLGFDGTETDSGTDAMTSEVTVSERSGASRSGVLDTTIKDYEPGNNFRNANFLGAFSDAANGTPSTPGLLHFDLSSLAGATVVSARLELALHLNLNASFTDAAIEVRELTEPWDIDVVNFVERSAGQSWSTPGATGDARGAVIASGNGPTGSDRLTLELDTATVQRWVDSPDRNSGVILLETGGTGLGVWMCSSEFDDETRRPQLTLEIAP